MWVTDPFLELMQEIPSFVAFSFHACMFQAKRKKDTAIWTSIKEFRRHLERKCDDKHEHLPWGRAATHNGFAAADECAYNEHMCASWAQALSDHALAMGFSPPALDMQQGIGRFDMNQINKTILGCLPRGRKVPPILTDWLEPRLFNIDGLAAIQALPVGKRIPDAITAFPLGSKLVRFTDENGVAFDPKPQQCFGNNHDNLDGCSDMPKFAPVGIPREPLDFVRCACSLVHPVLRAMQVGGPMLEAIDSYGDGDGLDFRRVQCGFSQELLRLISEQQSEERELHSTLPEHLQRVLKGKCLCLFKRLLDDCEYPDAKIADELTRGFPLCGWLPSSEVFPPKLRPPDIHMDTLAKMSASFSARSVSATKPTGDGELYRLLWQATLDEATAGFLTGPFRVDQLPPGAIASPRFGLMQKSKLRPIDNFSASHVNSATGLQDKLQVDPIDEICAMIKAWAQRSDGSVRLVGRSYDLRKAYRQIGISEDHLGFAWICVWSPDDQCPKLFRMESMAFGATASVGAFLRLSQALKCLGIAKAALVWSSFYDDFVCVCPAPAAAQVDRMVRLLFQALVATQRADETLFSLSLKRS